MMPMPGGSVTNLDKLLRTWCIHLRDHQVVADMKLARKLVVPEGAAAGDRPTLLFRDRHRSNKEDWWPQSD